MSSHWTKENIQMKESDLIYRQEEKACQSKFRKYKNTVKLCFQIKKRCTSGLNNTRVNIYTALSQAGVGIAGQPA